MSASGGLPRGQRDRHVATTRLTVPAEAFREKAVRRDAKLSDQNGRAPAIALKVLKLMPFYLSSIPE